MANNKNKKIYLKYPVIVEGKYDKIKLSSFVASTIVSMDGFSVFNNKEKLALIRSLASSGGIILLTDSDKAGFFIRSRLKSLLGSGVNLINLYIPQIVGKEKRKQDAGKDGLIGVEGIDKKILFDIVKDFTQDSTKIENTRQITKSDFFEDGLSGNDNSGRKREKLAKAYGLPLGMSANLLIEAVNLLSDFEEYKLMIKESESED